MAKPATAPNNPIKPHFTAKGAKGAKVRKGLINGNAPPTGVADKVVQAFEFLSEPLRPLRFKCLFLEDTCVLSAACHE
jgi:hypothetical protein